MSNTDDNRKSSFKLFWGNITFTNEPLWYRIVVILLLLGAVITIVYLMKEGFQRSVIRGLIDHS
jgi:hypothetical protein